MPSKTESKENLVPNEKEDDAEKGISDYNISASEEYILSEVEKKFILAVERGDAATTKRIIDENRSNTEEFNINCLDPLNRSALISAIENENEDLIILLLDENIKVGDALLHAISEEYVEAVEELLQWEEEHHVEGTPYSWEAVDRSKSDFTPDITPLILAAHRNNYEILKILLDRGASLPMPHDVKCGCDICIRSQESDSLRHSQSRINAYKALSASSLIALSSRDPVLTAFELSWELKHLQTMESEFRDAYTEMRNEVQEFVSSLLDHARNSLELEIMLNYNPEADTDVWMPGQRQTLERLKLAIKYKQKAFVAHPNVQQLLAAIWYDGLPGFRRKTGFQQIVQVLVMGCSFPIYSMNYIVAPNSDRAKLMKKPFVKFIMHSTSYMFFLMLLAGASLRIIPIVFEILRFPWMLEMLAEWKKYERGSLPGPIELFIIMYIGSLIFGELKALYDEGLFEYICDLWNIVDFIQNSFYVTWIMMRIVSWVITHRDLWYRNINPYFPRENWHPFDPMLIAEGAFAAGMIFSFLKLVHIFSINPHLGPLQVSLGRMIIDIIKFFFIYTLVLFAFGCGFNLLLMYYAEMEKKKCYHLHPEVADFDDQEKACTIWRRFANLFETSQSLFWASFGLVDLVSFELAGMKGFTRFWGLLMFGSYSVINIIVLLNMLIAMMSNSYQVIYEKADVEWKFARSQLWMSYFEDGGTLPPPFNMCPSIKLIQQTFGGKQNTRKRSVLRRTKEKALLLHDKVMRLLIRRYVTCEQRKRDDFGITEDDIIEVRSDISSFRFELLDILSKNKMKVPDIDKKGELGGTNKKTKVLERRIKKDFQIGIVESLKKEMTEGDNATKDVFSSIAKVIGKKKESVRNPSGSRKEKKNWNAIVKKNFMAGDPIGSSKDRVTRQSQRSLRRKIIAEEDKKWTEIDQENLLKFNPKLQTVGPATRVAYVKFMKPTLQKREEMSSISENEAGPSGSKPDGSAAVRKPTLKAVAYKSVDKKLPPPPPSDAQAQKSAAPSAPGKPSEPPKSDAKSAISSAPSGAKPDASKGTEPSKTGDPKKTESKPDATKPSGGDTKKPEAGGGDSKKPGTGGDDSKKPDAGADSKKPSGDAPKSDSSKAPAPKTDAPKGDTTKPDSSKPDANKPSGGDAKKPATTGDSKKPESKVDAPKVDPSKPATGGAGDAKKAADAPSGGDKSGAKPADKPADKGADKSAAAPKAGDKPSGGGATATGAASATKPADSKTSAAASAAMNTAASGAAGDRGKSVVTGKMISGWL